MEWKTYDVSVGSTYSFKVGDIVQVRIKGGEAIYNSADGKTHSVQGTNGLIAQGAIVDASATSIDLIAPVVPPDDNGDDNYRPTIVLTLNPIGLTAKNFTNPVDDVLVDSTKIQVLRQEITSAKSKTVVTKEKLAYYHNKIKSLLDTKGKIKTIQIGPYTYTPNNDGLVNLPGDIVQMESATNEFTLVGKSYDNSVNSYVNKNLKFDFSETDKLEISRWVNTETPTVYDLPSTGYVDGLAAAATKLKLEKVDALPATGEEGKIYLVPNAGSGVNVYDEYFWYNKGTDADPNYVFELFGTTAVDLTNYIQETDLVEITTSEIDDMFATTP